jgi:hypothetical protein
MSLLRVDTIRDKNGTSAPTFDKGINVTGNVDVNGTSNAVLVTGNNGNFVGIVTAANFICYSDANLKDNIQELTDSLSKITNLQGVEFTWKDSNNTSIGLIAQEVEKAIPGVVSEVNGTKTVNYIALIPILIEAIKELKQEIEDVRNNK